MIDTTLQGPRRGGVAGLGREARIVAQQAGERGKDLPLGLIVAKGGGDNTERKQRA